ncbi:MAG: winged helix DNA-binding domain-containing protein [Chloroflexota bacterium]
MRLTARQLNRATLARQLLLRRGRLDVVEAVRRIVAIQAQEPPSPYIALWNRLDPFDPRDLDAAFAAQDVVKTQLMRITLHAVAAVDYPAFHAAMQPTLRAARLHDRRFTAEGVSIEEADALVPEALAYAGSPRTNTDVERWLEGRFGAPKPRVWWALRQYGPFVHGVTGGPWAFGPRPAYVAARDQARSADTAESVRWLVRRYLEGFGPATMADIAQFGTIYRPPVQRALTELREELVEFEGPDDATLYDVPGGVIPTDDTAAAPRLLPMWDSALLAYKDRSRIVPPAYRTVVMRSNGDVLPTLLVDGFVAGVWRPVEDGIEATAFRQLSEGEWTGIDDEARSLLTFLDGRDRRVYQGRFAHWWDGLPTAEVRVVGAERRDRT